MLGAYVTRADGGDPAWVGDEGRPPEGLLLPSSLMEDSHTETNQTGFSERAKRKGPGCRPQTRGKGHIRSTRPWRTRQSLLSQFLHGKTEAERR